MTLILGTICIVLYAVFLFGVYALNRMGSDEFNG